MAKRTPQPRASAEKLDAGRPVLGVLLHFEPREISLKPNEVPPNILLWVWKCLQAGARRYEIYLILRDRMLELLKNRPDATEARIHACFSTLVRLIDSKSDEEIAENFENNQALVIEYPKPQKDEGLIPRDTPASEKQKLELPEIPPRMWPGRQRGRPSADAQDPLIKFLKDVYGQYLPRHKNALRNYIFQNDPKLYIAIRDYERSNELPTKLQMTTRDEKYVARAKMAEAVGFAGLSERERARAKAALTKAKAKLKAKNGPKSTPH